MPFDHTKVKLGKRAAVPSPLSPKFKTYLKAEALPHIPVAYHWGAGVPHWPMYGNDTLGDCTIAAVGHQAGVWTFRESGSELIIPETTIVSAYSAVSGYVPGDPSTDNGAVMTTVLSYWEKTGVGGSKIQTYATVTPSNNTEVKAAIYIFGGCYIGIQLPITAQAQSVLNGEWSLEEDYQTDPNAQPGSWGGHCVPLIGYTAAGPQFITWGMPMTMSWAFFNYYADEAYAPLSPEWVAKGNISPNKFDLAQLEADLGLV